MTKEFRWYDMNKTKKKKKKRDKNVLKFYQNYTYKRRTIRRKEKEYKYNILYKNKYHFLPIFT